MITKLCLIRISSPSLLFDLVFGRRLLACARIMASTPLLCGSTICTFVPVGACLLIVMQYSFRRIRSLHQLPIMASPQLPQSVSKQCRGGQEFLLMRRVNVDAVAVLACEVCGKFQPNKASRAQRLGVLPQPNRAHPLHRVGRQATAAIGASRRACCRLRLRRVRGEGWSSVCGALEAVLKLVDCHASRTHERHRIERVVVLVVVLVLASRQKVSHRLLAGCLGHEATGGRGVAQHLERLVSLLACPQSLSFPQLLRLPRRSGRGTRRGGRLSRRA
mmetsp:Transcript_29186/g.72777  ORF Transcript_29186/g.72777 Transcript_29186/m.72777 type:complete len:276 (-) Transcript_29186:230-1057(-)